MTIRKNRRFVKTKEIKKENLLPKFAELVILQ